MARGIKEYRFGADRLEGRSGKVKAMAKRTRLVFSVPSLSGERHACGRPKKKGTYEKRTVERRVEW